MLQGAVLDESLKAEFIVVLAAANVNARTSQLPAACRLWQVIAYADQRYRIFGETIDIAVRNLQLLDVHRLLFWSSFVTLCNAKCEATCS